MDLLGVGPLELIFVLLIIFLVIGPKDMAATGRKIGRFLSTVRKSEFWRGVNQITREMRTLPTTLMREAELEDAKKELEQTTKDLEKEFGEVKNMSQAFEAPELKKIDKEIREELGEEPKILPDPTPPSSEDIQESDETVQVEEISEEVSEEVSNEEGED